MRFVLFVGAMYNNYDQSSTLLTMCSCVERTNHKGLSMKLSRLKYHSGAYLCIFSPKLTYRTQAHKRRKHTYYDHRPPTNHTTSLITASKSKV